MDYEIVKARLEDVVGLHKMLLDREDGMVLPRTLHQLYTHIRDFYVLLHHDKNGTELVGCCALAMCWAEIAEIRTLYILPEHRKKGYAKKMISACLSEARDLKLARIFVLTDQIEFFSYMGFSEVSKDELPQKVWADCLHCPRFPNCDEIAMLYNL